MKVKEFKDSKAFDELKVWKVPGSVHYKGVGTAGPPWPLKSLWRFASLPNKEGQSRPDHVRLLAVSDPLLRPFLTPKQ